MITNKQLRVVLETQLHLTEIREKKTEVSSDAA
jgi:hypothetical protein